MDEWLLTEIMDNRFIDVKNVNFDFDITKEFTWDFRELVEIKKRKRIVHKIYKPTMKILGKIRDVQAFEKSRKTGQLVSKVTPFKGYSFFEYLSDKHDGDPEKVAQQDKQHELNVNHGGKPIPKEKLSEDAETRGRRVQQRN